ncbi:MAG: hypothetical protein KME64_03050 [Scytonematopsis contorta HA4267-MV1]|nr:hypothetical protein [Scytonematopsis contorta HA4267-MV1]
MGNREWRVGVRNLGIPHSPFLHSRLSIPNSRFPIPHSRFPIPHSPLPIQNLSSKLTIGVKIGKTTFESKNGITENIRGNYPIPLVFSYFLDPIFYNSPMSSECFP